jgi:hypothetical protein
MAHLARSDEREHLAVDDNLGEYQAVSGLAIAGLLLGLASILTLVHLLFILIAAAAVVVNALALRRIAVASPELVGRKAALVGLALSLIFGISAPIERGFRRHALRAESMKIAEEWFNGLRDNQPEISHRLTQRPITAAARAQPALKTYINGGLPFESLQKFVHESPIELLLRLGKQAHVRWYENEETWFEQESEGVRDFYVITVGKGPQAVSFFILLGTTRSRDLATGDLQWQVTKRNFAPFPPPRLMKSFGG